MDLRDPHPNIAITGPSGKSDLAFFAFLAKIN
jgi:hypothetical protein